MTEDPSHSLLIASLRASRSLLVPTATAARFLCIVAGLASFNHLIWSGGAGGAEKLISRLSAPAALIVFVGAGWIIGRLLRTWAGVVDAMIVEVEAAVRTADLIEKQVAPALGRIAEALEKSPRQAADDGQASLRAEIRAATKAGDWSRAESMARDFPEPLEGSRLLESVAEGRRAAVEDLMDQLNASRDANDPVRVLELRESLSSALDHAARKELDGPLVKWIMNAIQKRLLIVPMSPDVPALAARAAEVFAATTEGVSLRRALPTLRRSAGLCPRCARPYKGIDDACPLCLAPAPAPVSEGEAGPVDGVVPS